MLEKTIKLSEQSYFKTYIIERSSYIQSGDTNTWQPEKRPAVVILPGGGYQYIADSEDEPVVYHFLTKGYSCFSLHYSVGEESAYPTPLYELFKTVAHIRKNATAWGIDPEAIAVCGFSAGAHLAGLGATQYCLKDIQKELGLEETLIRPDAAILCYPITNIDRLNRENPARVATWGAMLGGVNPKTNVTEYVSDKMSPVFLWHTRTDGIVPVSQSIELIEKMYSHNVRFECHIFGEGYHGLSTNDVLSNYQGNIQGGVVVPNVSRWVDMCTKWLNNCFRFNTNGN